jgi:putative hydrolase of the HAD superfamily
MFETFNDLNIADAGVHFDVFFEIYSRNNSTLWEAYRNKEINKKELTKQRFQLTFDALNIGGIDAQKMNDLYLVHMAEQTFLMDGALDILNYLKAKRYKLYIITNGFRDVQHAKMKNSGLTPYFEKIFISEEIKTPKPGYEIFEYAIKSANAKKSHSIMIGDDWEVDVLGAVGFGLDAVLLLSEKQEEKPAKDAVASCNDKVYKIRKLKDLQHFL